MGNFPGGEHFSGGNFIGGFFPGGNFPYIIYSIHRTIKREHTRFRQLPLFTFSLNSGDT